ncbi:hypothetical protein G6F68_017529 [Rhizopus microsporus]|nr:hypothetical protein G6F68_017529 [Rhizopus microsporus]
MAHALGQHLGHDVVDVPPGAAVEGIGGVAILATQWAAGQAHEHGRPAGGIGFALQRGEDLGDLQAWQRRLHDVAGGGDGIGRDNGGHGGYVLVGHVAGGYRGR